MRLIREFFCLDKKFFVYQFLSRNLKVKYHRSYLGLFWTILTPLAMGAIYYFVFTKIMGVNRPYYLPYVISGSLLWGFFSSTLIEGLDGLVNNISLLTKVALPVQVFALVGTLTNLMTLSFSLPIIFGAAYFFGDTFGLATPLFILQIALLSVMSYGLALTLGIAYVYFRDIKQVVGITLQIWFYATPVIYTEEMIPEKYRQLLLLNPIGPLFVSMRRTLIHASPPDTTDILQPLFWTMVIVLIAFVLLRKFGRSIAEAL